MDLISSSGTDPIFTSLESSDSLRCSECGAKESVWLCITCGELSCGRYVQAHALKHQENFITHSVCLETKELSVFCYKCDDFVINDTKNKCIEFLRKKIYQRSMLERLDSEKTRLLRPRGKRVVTSPVIGGSTPKKSKTSPLSKLLVRKKVKSPQKKKS